MILRTWRGRADPANPTGYVEHFERQVVPELRSVDGFLGSTLVRKIDSDVIEFLVITRWRSLETIRAFAGDDVGRAVVEPGAKAALISFDERVEHYEVLAEVETA